MGHELRTRLCQTLGIEYPIFSVGFGEGAGPELVAAVSNAGAFGVLGGDGLEPAAVPERIAQVRALTDRPFGFNLIIVDDEEYRAFVQGMIAAAVSQRVTALVFFWGNPSPYVELAHSRGVKVLVQVGSVDEAASAAAAGVDAVIAQGIEAGGHVRGTESIWELLPAVVEAVKPVPVLASGGIGDGAGLARALELGAQGVSLGTRFVASNEAFFHPAYKKRIVESTAKDTVYSELYDTWWPGAPHRTIRNKTYEEWEAAGRPPSGKRPGEDTIIGRRRRGPAREFQEWPRYAVGSIPPNFEGDLERVPMFAGESCTVVNDIKPAAEIVRDLVRDARGERAHPSH
jgi:nitronate monooxygenase